MLYCIRKVGTEMIDLYRNIKQLREDKGLSQDELAKKTGYTSRSSIAKIEKGEVDLPRSKIIAFAEAKKGWLNSNNYIDSCLIPCLWRFPFA